MKWLAVFLLMMPLITCAPSNLSAGLVLYYPFNNSIKDESGYQNDPSVIKAPMTKDRFGKANAAVKFNGTDNYIRIPDDASLRFRNGFSISAWIMVSGFYEGTCHGNRVIMKGYSDDNNGNYLLTFDDNFSSGGTNCETRFPDTRKQSFYGPHAAPVTYDYIVPGKWYLVTFTYDGNIALLYVDCKLQAKGKIRNYSFSNTEDLFFGKMDNAQFPYWFNGSLDEVRIYNRPLKQDEIRALCDEKANTPAPLLTCTDKNTVQADFDFRVSACNTVSFDLKTTQVKNFESVKWEFGNGKNSGKRSPDHTYARNGSYKAKAIVTSKNGCRDTASREISIRPLKTDFSYAETGIPGNIQFKAGSNNATFSWDFGDGKQVNGENQTTHLYEVQGDFRVKMFATNNLGCRDTVEKTIPVHLPVLITESSQQPPPASVVDAVPLPHDITTRGKELIRTITVDNDSIQVMLFDNGIIDGDSITLVYRQEVLISKKVLGTRPISFTLNVDRLQEKNELLMYAENLGSIPPNTALLIIQDGAKRHEVNISSSKKNSGVVSFILSR